MMDNLKTYLGKRGYCIYKDKISLEEQRSIREELMISPYIPKSPIAPQKFPVYRESPKKFYVPRFYGESLYGVPDTNKLGIPETIDLQ